MIGDLLPTLHIIHVWASSEPLQRLILHTYRQCSGPWHFGVDPDPDQRIHAFDKWIRILLFSSLTFKMPTKNYFSKKEFLLITFWEGTFTSFFKDEKSKRSHKTVGIKVFLTIFACWSGSGSIPLTNGSGFGSGTCLQVRQGMALHCIAVAVNCFSAFFLLKNKKLRKREFILQNVY